MGDDIAVAPDRAARTVVAAGRIVVGLLWMSNTGWKVPPAFGENGNRDLYRFTTAAVDQPVFPPFSFVVEHVVLPNFRFFGWIVLLVEIALGAFLTFGIATRLWAVVGGVHATVIALCVLRLRGEWPWSYYLMIVANLLLFADGGRPLRRDRRCGAAGAGHQPGPGGPPVVEGARDARRYRVPVLVLVGGRRPGRARRHGDGAVVGPWGDRRARRSSSSTSTRSTSPAVWPWRRSACWPSRACCPTRRCPCGSPPDWAVRWPCSGCSPGGTTPDNLFGLDGRTVSLLVGLASAYAAVAWAAARRARLGCAPWTTPRSPTSSTALSPPITLDRPDQLNAFTGTMMRELHRRLRPHRRRRRRAGGDRHGPRSRLLRRRRPVGRR